MINIGKICTHHVFVIEKQKSVHEAAVLMKKHGIKKLLIIEEKDHTYSPISFLTSYDIVTGIIADEINAKETTIEEIMPNNALFFAQENQKAEDVLKIMVDNGIDQMPVLDQDNKLIGIATIDNIILSLEREINGTGLKYLVPSTSREDFNCLNLVSKVIAAQMPEHFNY